MSARDASTGSSVRSGRPAPGRLTGALSLFAAALRRVIGAPDYERYVTHVRAAHPGARPMSPEEFTREALGRRYGTGAGRCC